jgi:hypothetical protein
MPATLLAQKRAASGWVLALKQHLRLPAALAREQPPGDVQPVVVGCGHHAHGAPPQPAHTAWIAAHCWGVTVRSHRTLIRA